MDRTSYIQQIKVALAHTRRKLVLLSIVVAGFVVFQSYPDKAPIYFAIAVPVCIAALCIWAIPMRKTFAHNAPCCSACRKPVGLLTWRKATNTGLCPHCHGALFGPYPVIQADGYAAA
jgi:hypothetical protein